MDYHLTHAFRVDAFGKPIPPPPTHGMEAAARYYAMRDYAETERCCLEIIEQEPRHFDALHLMGVICLNQSLLPEAIQYLTRAQQERPDDPQVHYHLGTTLLELRRYAEAAAQFGETLTVVADHVDAINNLGNAFVGLQHHAEAIDCFRRALKLQPDCSPAHYNLGRSLVALDRQEEAVDSFRAALAGNLTGAGPDRIVAIYGSLGQALAELGRYDEALDACHAMSQFNPGAAEWNTSLVLLQIGRFDEGWHKYEGRWSAPDHDPPHPGARVPTLAEVAGQRVLLTCEQGHGDMIQFARYAPMLARAGASVTLQTYRELHDLMQTIEGIDTVVTDQEAEPSVDIITPLLSLPLVFGTNLTSIPADVPYLRAPPKRLAAWEQRLGPPTRPRVGICWWGSQHIPKRSLPIERLLPILRLPQIEFHALQKEIPPPQRDWLQQHKLLVDHSAGLDDFADTAALISLMDMVVTIDTSVAHLACALGKPVGIMLQFSADWRWLLDRDDSPWYPTAHLFRQKRRGDWDGVVAVVAQVLAAWSDRFKSNVTTDERG